MQQMHGTGIVWKCLEDVTLQGTYCACDRHIRCVIIPDNMQRPDCETKLTDTCVHGTGWC